MRAFNVILTIAAWVCGNAFAGEAETNATAVHVSWEKATRLWISSFEPITLTTEHRELPMPSTFDMELLQMPSAMGTNDLRRLEVTMPCTPMIPGWMAVEWRTNYAFFGGQLLSAADEAHLDSQSLRKILAIIRNKESPNVAFLPVEATSTWQNGEPVWIVDLRWEKADILERADHIGRGTLGHILRFVFTQKTLKVVGGMSCG